MKKYLFLLLLLPMAGYAQAVPGTANIKWTLPLTGTNGTPLTGTQALTKVQVFVATATIPDGSTMTPTVELGPTVTQASVTLQVTNGSTLYTRVKACNSVGCSGFSNEGSKVVQIPDVPPGVPTSVTITISITP